MTILAGWLEQQILGNKKPRVSGRAFYKSENTHSEIIIMQKKDLVNKKAQSRAALRMFYELQFICNAKGRRIGTEEIQAKLSALGFVASLRTIQRDLNQLEGVNAPIKSDGHHPQGWSFFSANLLKEVA